MPNTFRQDVINTAQTLIKADVAFDKKDKAQGVARLELAMALAMFVSRTKPSLDIDKNDKNSWRKEFGLDDGDSKVFFRVGRKLATRSTAQLLEIEKLMDEQGDVSEEEMHIPNPATIDRFSKALPSTVSNWMK